MSASWTLDIGGVAVALDGPAERISPFADAWSGWSGGRARWTVYLTEDERLAPPEGPYFAARPYFRNGSCFLRTRGILGEVISGARTGELRFHPAADTGDIVYFLRTVFALAAFDRQKILFHAAGIVHDEQTYCLFGHSGSGKTTASRLSGDKPVLSDDLLLVSPIDNGADVWATPFGRRRRPELQVAPLRALLRLVQASEDRLSPMSRGEALAALAANSPVINADSERVTRLMDMWARILEKIPAQRLYFRKADTFWEVIDAHFG